jgi:hypothetical protein
VARSRSRRVNLSAALEADHGASAPLITAGNKGVPLCARYQHSRALTKSSHAPWPEATALPGPNVEVRWVCYALPSSV